MKKMLKVSLNLVYILVICFCFVGINSNNFIHSVKEKKQDVQVKLVKEELSIPVSECTTLHDVAESLPVMEIRYFKMERS